MHEVLFLFGKEEVLHGMVQNMRQKYQNSIDKFAQGIIISQIETLLNCSERFYQRQFITRKIANHYVLDKLEALLNAYFSNDDLITKDLPSVQFVAISLDVSTSYLGKLLKTLTGQSTQQHIHEWLIKKPKRNYPAHVPR